MSRSSRPFADPRPAKQPDGVRRCECPGCEAPGEYRAPRSRDDLGSYFWFCLDHVREYNRQWNYYAGLNPEEIEREIRAATTWWRPTWPLGAQSAAAQRPRHAPPHVELGAFSMEGWDSRPPRVDPAAQGWRPRPGSEEERALAVFDMAPPVTRETVKARYKTLVKLHHPDANGGDKAAEERLKIINRAYSALIAVPEL